MTLMPFYFMRAVAAAELTLGATLGDAFVIVIAAILLLMITIAIHLLNHIEKKYEASD